ncbi:hypothetical protein N566_24140 [Streptomycetaceae bacterium MP113-05]|nr:hypothetical protein N566_24140 [Streptomycetaceae bacterium MP113-05]
MNAVIASEVACPGKLHFVATPRFDQRTLDFVSLMNQIAAARP